MCGRTRLTIPFRQLAALLRCEADTDQLEGAMRERNDIRPTQSVPVVRMVEGKRRLELVRWGLVPPWAPGLAFGNRCINARTETVATSRAFRAALRSKRCGVIADAFFEWKRIDPKTKERQSIHLPEFRPMALAGLWERWTSPDGEVVDTCTVLTRESEGFMRELHDRTPIVLTADALDAWIDPTEPHPLRLLASNENAALIIESAAAMDRKPRRSESTQRSLF